MRLVLRATSSPAEALGAQSAAAASMVTRIAGLVMSIGFWSFAPKVDSESITRKRDEGYGFTLVKSFTS